MAKLGFIRVLVIILLLTASCRKLEEYPIVPEITFEGFVLLQNQETGVVDKGLLRIGYRDGDGDIGLAQGDTSFPFQPAGDYYYNLIIRYFEQQNGEFVELPLISWNELQQRYDTATFSARIPPLIPKDESKAIKGIIEDELFINNPLSDFDTIMFKVQLIDRALNKSNEVSSPPIVRPGV